MSMTTRIRILYLFVTLLTLSSSAFLPKVFAAGFFQVNIIVDPAKCGTVTIAEGKFSNGGVVNVVGGAYPISFNANSTCIFSGWSASGGALVLPSGILATSATAIVMGPGTLIAKAIYTATTSTTTSMTGRFTVTATVTSSVSTTVTTTISATTICATTNSRAVNTSAAPGPENQSSLELINSSERSEPFSPMRREQIFGFLAATLAAALVISNLFLLKSRKNVRSKQKI